VKFQALYLAVETFTCWGDVCTLEKCMLKKIVTKIAEEIPNFERDIIIENCVGSLFTKRLLK